jgi:stearoyl-CoA desaturase (delta-9 desaturase)
VWGLGPLQRSAWARNRHWNHHAFGNAAKFAQSWWQVDIGWYTIRLLEMVGFATGVKRQKPKKGRLAGAGAPLAA